MVENTTPLIYSRFIEIDEILELIPHIDPQFAINIINLMGLYRGLFGNEDRMMDSIFGLLKAKPDDQDMQMTIQQIYDAEEKLLIKHNRQIA